ncbi:hypothetical protein PTNB73_01430 [Pyrenophora teres f. teres]|uniref:Uncharacterized protein n=1 Tax=Pyrenophora teres f. teres TaxID=97479 RepID=A0A6S6W0R0_9PLEO|nr:hypothetical protein PTNB85_01425 [Pyrenophora teres f. teres]KAE8854259.1 hypothetical protein HRS9122_01251 [Pyrenophora teres f. teres]KAE8872279.1 hypothetical protein PTNB73_01430 [Pyrenophora teres f. teres]CAE7028374.1 hypothetical protein PTTW11_04417 [Pyrenophora teres f. teres]
MDSPSGYVIVTKYTTVYPTDSVQTSTAATTVSSAGRTLTTVASSKVRLGSTAPASTFSTLISSSSAVVSMPAASSTTSILPSSSITGVPTEVPAGAPVAFKHQFDDTSIRIFAAAFAVLGLLLLVTVCYMIYLRCQGKCPRCNDMAKQLEKWQSGELKRITPEMVRQREAFNKSASSSNASSELEIEMASLGGATAARSVALDRPKPNKQPTFWDKAKGKLFYIRKEEEPVGDVESSPETQHVHYVTNLEATHNDTGPSHRVSLERPQPPIEYEQNLNHLYQPRASTYTYTSQPDASHASRVFTDYAPTIVSQPRGPLRKEDDEPSRYTAFVVAEKQQRLQAAEQALQSDEYKRAESILKRASASEHQLRRALSIVNFADQSYNLARAPTLYMKSSTPTDRAGPAQVEQYEMPEWRRKGNKAPESDEI